MAKTVWKYQYIQWEWIDEKRDDREGAQSLINHCSLTKVGKM